MGSLVDRLVKEAIQDYNGAGGAIEKTASTEEVHSSANEIADELEKLAYSGQSVGTNSPMEKILEVAAVHEAITGENILERIRI